MRRILLQILRGKPAPRCVETKHISTRHCPYRHPVNVFPAIPATSRRVFHPISFCRMVRIIRQHLPPHITAPPPIIRFQKSLTPLHRAQVHLWQHRTLRCIMHQPTHSGPSHKPSPGSLLRHLDISITCRRLILRLKFQPDLPLPIRCQQPAGHMLTTGTIQVSHNLPARHLRILSSLAATPRQRGIRRSTTTSRRSAPARRSRPQTERRATPRLNAPTLPLLIVYLRLLVFLDIHHSPSPSVAFGSRYSTTGSHCLVLRLHRAFT